MWAEVAAFNPLAPNTLSMSLKPSLQDVRFFSLFADYLNVILSEAWDMTRLLKQTENMRLNDER